VARAIDLGVNYFDMGPAYGRGEAEERGGPAMEPYRNKIFLAGKTGMRTKAEAASELRESLKRMRTDHFDLYQFHAVTTMEEVKTIVGPRGALEAFVEAREQGLVRHLGFSAHTEEAALALMGHYDFDSILFPGQLCHMVPGTLQPVRARKGTGKTDGYPGAQDTGQDTLDRRGGAQLEEAVALARRDLRRGANRVALGPVAAGNRLGQPRSRGVPVVDDRGRKGAAPPDGRRGEHDRRLQKRHRADLPPQIGARRLQDLRAVHQRGAYPRTHRVGVV